MAKIKIAFIIDTILFPTAGTEKQLLLLIKNLKRNKFEPILCCLRNSDWLKKEFNLCPIYIIGINSFKLPSSYFRILKFSRFLRIHQFDIVQTYFKDANTIGIVAARFAGIKKVISTRRGLPYWKNIYELRFLRFINKFVMLFMANSYSTKKWISKVEGIPEEKIHVIYNGIELDPFKENHKGIRQKYKRLLNIPDNIYVIGIVSNLRPAKSIDIFLKAAQLVISELPQTRFIIVGEGNEKKKLIEFSVKLGLQDKVIFMGERKDVPSILKAFDLGVLSSHSESFSNSIIEYLAAGLPVVCTDVRGCREVIDDEVNGFIVPVGDYKAMADKIVTIFRGGLPNLKKPESLKKVEKKFLLSKIISDYEKTYINLINVAQ